MEIMLEQFKTIFDRPEKVKGLRKKILDLAIRGKLTNQIERCSSEELFKKIIDAKIKFYKENYSKKAKILSSNENISLEFSIPYEWKIICIGDLMELVNGKAFKPTEWSKTGLPIVRIQNLNNINATFNYCDFEVDKKYYIDNNELLIGWSGTPGTSFGASIWNRGKGVLNQHIFKAVPYLECINKEFLKIFINARLDEMIEQSHGGVGLKHITKGKFETMGIPLPTLKEQELIVKKVNLLMLLCDKLENILEKKVYYGELCAKSIFNLVSEVSNSEELEKALRIIGASFKSISLEDNAIKELKKCIIQLAAQGKLVEQNPKDEPAEILLEQIIKEKAKLIEEKKIRKEKALPAIDEDKVPYRLPKEWLWVRLGFVTDYGMNVSVKNDEVDEDTWVLELEDIEKDTSKLLKRVKFNARRFQSTKLKFKENDVLYCKLRPYLNKVIVADSDGVCSSEIMPLRGYYNIYPKYLMYMLKRPDFIKYVNEITYGTKMPRLGTDDARNTLIPLAPYNEQKRIVEKLDSLMDLCDELDKKVQKQKEYSNKLMESILNNTL